MRFQAVAFELIPLSKLFANICVFEMYSRGQDRKPELKVEKRLRFQTKLHSCGQDKKYGHAVIVTNV